ncbi:MAG: DNRLRE domain-containing protein [Solirubrobacteraceae bacterium]|nr:DNRLRE domain-containing protein [Solirubrobacteraceae bacterium]
MRFAFGRRFHVSSLAALVAAASLLVVCLVISAATASSQVRVPGPGELQAVGVETEPVGPEVVSLRTETSRSYRKADGGLQTRFSLAPVNYRDGEGVWRAIDPSLRRTAAGLETTAGPLRVQLPERANGGRVRLDRGGDWLSFGLRGARGVAAKVAGREARFAEALPGVSVDYEVGAESVKESLVLASASAPSTYTFDVAASSGLTPELEENGEVVFRDGAGSRRFTMETPWMQDANGEMSYDVRYEIDPGAGSGWTVRVVADDQWLKDPDRSFPVVVDPTTYYGIAKLCEIASGTLSNTNNCTTAEMAVNVGRESGRVHRALVAFDQVELQAALGDSLITKADLFFEWTTSTPADVTLDAHQITKTWSPLATWFKYNTTWPWSRPGGDYQPEYDTRRTLLSAWEGGWAGLGLGRIVQGWVDGSIANQGVAVKPQNEGITRLDTLDGIGLVVESRPRRGIEPQASFERVQPTASATVQVNVANGNLVYAEEDARLSAGSDALAVERVFNSRGDLATGTFGTGWSTNRGAETTLWQHWVDDSYILEGPGGLSGRFYRRSAGYLAPPGWNASLVENGDDTVSITFNSTGERWDFDTADPRRLTKVVKGAYEQSLTYDAGRLLEISDNQGNALAYGYDAADRLTSLSNGSTARQYDIDTADRLAKFTDQSGKDTTYTYDPDARLSEITYPGASRIALAYDSAGRVTSIVEKADTSTANERTTTFAYSSPTAPCVGSDFGKTVVTYPNSQTRTYCYSRTNAVRAAAPVTTTDITDPVLTLAGGAWEDRAGWYGTGTAALHAFGSDGHSGVKTVETKVNDAVVDTNTQACAAGRCSMQRDVDIDLATMDEGTNEAEVTVTDIANRTTTREWNVRVDRTQPALSLDGTLWSDRNDWADQQDLDLTAQATDGASGLSSVEVLVDGQRKSYETQSCAAGGCGLEASASVDANGLTAGEHTVEVIAVDHAGNERTESWTVNVDHGDPTVSLSGAVADADGDSLEVGTHSLSIDAADAPSQPGSGVRSVEIRVDGSQVDLIEQSCPQGGCALFHVGSLDATSLPPGQHTVRVVVTDGVGRSSFEEVSFEVTDPGAGMEPIEAPPIDPTLPSTTANSTEFIYSGSDPVQTGMDPEVLEEKRVAVIRGKVRDRSGEPQGNVKVTVLDHPEYGETVTRSDGEVYLVLNGGQQYTLTYEKEGFLPLQRQVDAPWQNWEVTDDVVLVGLDGESTEVDFGEPLDEPVVHEADPVTDSDGTRQAKILLPEGTEATMTMPDGSSQPLATATIRATEYTVGETGDEAMPGSLPATSAYTYAVEYSIDEARAAGAETVEFDEPVVAYEDNFIDMPVGVAVPVGYYDRDEGEWQPSPDGRVLKVLSEADGKAQLDVMGQGDPATATQLDALAITDEERTKLAEMYAPGDEFWRVQLRHFSPYDFNWGPRLPVGAQSPKGTNVSGSTDGGCSAAGSVIGCEDQTLGESIPIEGTGLRLHYQSERTPGYTAGRTLRFKVAGDETPHPELQAIEVQAEIAGRKFTQTLQPQAGQEYELRWDGKDAFGRVVHGTQNVRVQVGYRYHFFYSTGRPWPFTDGEFVGGFYSFAAPPTAQDRVPDPAGYGVGGSAGPPSGCPYYLDPETGACIPLWAGVGGMPETRQDQVLTRIFHTTIGGMTVRTEDLGGWTMSNHHTYDATAKRLLHGDGTWRSAAGVSQVVRRIMSEAEGTSMTGSSQVTGLTVGADGSAYIAQCFAHRVLRRAPDGTVTVFAGTAVQGFSGDGGPASQAKLACPTGLDVEPGGGLLIADTFNNRVRRVAADGTMTTVAGNGSSAAGGDGGPATEASLRQPRDVAAGPAGEVYIADTENGRIRTVTPTGSIQTHLNVQPPQQCLGAAMCNYRPTAVSVGSDGTMYVVRDYRYSPYATTILRIRPGEDAPTAIADNEIASARPDEDGVPAATANVAATDVDVAANGDLYVAEYVHFKGGGRIRKIGSDGVIRLLAGDPNCPGALAPGGWLLPLPEVDDAKTACILSADLRLDVGPDGDPYITDGSRPGLRVITKSMPGLASGEVAIASEDGSSLFEFDADGRHIRTRDADTGTVVTTFTYTADGRLASQQDADGNIVAIDRDAQGSPEAIEGPFGARTLLDLRADGMLSSTTDPKSATSEFTYTTDGLLTGYTEPSGDEHAYGYDADGYLVTDESPDGETTTLTRTERSDGHAVTLTSNLGRTREFVVERRDGDLVYRKFTNAAGDATESFRRLDGTTKVEQADGTTAEATQGADPRFGTQSPFVATSVVTLPSNRSLGQSRARTAAMATPGDPLTLTGKTDTTTVNGKTSSTSYAGATKRYTSTSPTGREWKVDVDTKGRITRSETAGADPVEFDYDSRGRIDTVTAGSSTWTYSYATTGYLQAVQGPEGMSTSYETDANGQVTEATLPGSREVAFTYDVRGNLTSLTPPSRSPHTFEYTDGGKPSRIVPPAIAGVDADTEFAYDADGALASMTRPGGELVDFDYDTAGRPSEISSADGDIEISYHAGGAGKGKLDTVTAPGGQDLAFEYDGPLVTSVAASGGTEGELEYDYDTDLRPASVSLNGAGAVGYSYDNDGLLTAAGGMSISRETATGRVSGTTLGVTSTTRAFDTPGRLASLSASVSASPLLGKVYAYDDLDRVQTATETTPAGSVSFAYAYDAAGRLEAVTKDGQAYREYVYDANGNRTSDKRAGELAVSSVFDAQDRLVSRGTEQFSYTDAGELASRTDTATSETTTYHHTARGLVGVDLPDGTEITYDLDGMGRRVAVRHDGVVVSRFLYGLEAIGPVAELNPDNTVRSRFVYGTRSYVPDFMIRDGVTYQYVTDELGSVRRVVNTASGVVAQAVDYDPYGVVLADTDPGFQPFGFTGGLIDPDTGHVRLGYREYDPTLGRWLSKDPIDFDGGDTNLYAYVAGDPINTIDPDGLIGISLQNASDFAAGFGDWVTLGGTKQIRRALGSDGVVNPCSGFYTAGGVTSTVMAAIVTMGGGAAAGAGAATSTKVGSAASGEAAGAATSGSLRGRLLSRLKDETGSFDPKAFLKDSKTKTKAEIGDSQRDVDFVNRLNSVNARTGAQHPAGGGRMRRAAAAVLGILDQLR